MIISFGRVRGIKNLLIYIFIRLLLILLNLLPLNAAYNLAGWLGRISVRIFKSDRVTALENLCRAFPDQPEDKLMKIYIDSLQNIAYSAVDVLRFRKFGSEGILNMVEVEGLEHFDRAYDRGRGIVAVTGHISNFELIAAWFGQKGYKTAAVGRKIYDARLNRLLIENREAMKIRCIDSEASIRYFLKTLREGYAIGVLIDQDSLRYRGEFVDFFGKPAYTPVGPILLGRKAKAAVVPMNIMRTAMTCYKLTVHPEIEFDYDADPDDDIRRVLAKCTRVLERVIAEYPEHWVWMHRRWRTRPEDVETENKR